MLKLFLLRHAQAEGSYDTEDHARPLTLHGIKQAQGIASALPPINIAICSSAQRTRMTLNGITKARGVVQKTIYSDDIYNGSASNLLNAIQGCNTEETLLLIAHNPGIHQLGNILSTEDNNKIRETLRFSYAPATLSVLECPIEKWGDLKPGENKLAELIIPD